MKTYESIEKPWGTAQCIFRNGIVELWRNEINVDGKSSEGRFHKHRLKYNLFYVEYGELDLYVFNSEGGHRLLRLNPDNPQYNVFPGVFHRFHAIEETVLYEFYWTYCTEKDIIRERVT